MIYKYNLLVIQPCFSHQNLLSGQMTGIRHEEVPVLVPPTEQRIIANNQLDMTVITGDIQAPQALKTPAM